MESRLAHSISDVQIVFPALSEIVRVMTLQAGYNAAIVVIGATFLGVAAGVIGTFALLRGRALMGDALAHSALPGLGLAFIIGSSLGIGGKHLWLLLPGATISGVIGVLCVQFLLRYSRLREDAAIGAVLSCFFGLGVVLLSIIQSLGTGEEGGLHHFIYGQTAAMSSTDAYLTLSAALVAILFCTVLFKEFRLISFDQQFAKAEGWPVSSIDLAMMAVVVLVTVIGLQAVGLLLVVALLIVPAVGARFWTEHLKGMVIISALIGGLSGYLGSVASALLPRLPAGAVIVLVSGVIFFISFLFAPARGVVARVVANLKLGFRFAKDHLLREIYEEHEQQAAGLDLSDELLTQPIELQKLAVVRGWPQMIGPLYLALFSLRKLIKVRKIAGHRVVALLPQGIEQARSNVRNHRLWEEYLVSNAGFSPSHVDFSADLVEHYLSPQIISELESRLKDRLGEQLPPSIHALSRGS